MCGFRKIYLNILMKKFCLVLGLVASMVAVAQNKTPELKYTDAHQLRVINRAYTDTTPLYTRVPDALIGQMFEKSQFNATCACGIAVRFRTNARQIGVRYNLKYDFGMSWMAYTGIKGTDLYVLDEELGRWNYLSTSRPIKDSIQQKTYGVALEGKMYEYMIYLPLYDGINWLEVGVDSAATIEYPKVNNPRGDVKVLFYGTSVMQGGCATRPGMTQSSILQRRLGIECVNLGISGEGKVIHDNARVLAAADDHIACYVIDPLMNNTKEMIDTLGEGFLRIIHEAHPNTPIIMVAGQVQPQQKFDTHLREYNPVRNEIWKGIYTKLRKEGWKNLYWMDEGNFNGPETDGTVDGGHLSDLGFVYYADLVQPYIERALKKAKVKF